MVINPIGNTSIAAQVGIGVLCASYWRGMWYILDDNLFPNNPLQSSVASLAMGTIGLSFSQAAMAKLACQEMKKKNEKLPSKYTPLARFGSLYCVSTSCILVWRGSWMLWDVTYDHFYKKETSAHSTDEYHLTKSGAISHICAMVTLLALGRYSSVLGPPANASILKDKALKASTRTWKEYSASAKWFFK